ncbi:AMP-binding protein [Actinoplanes rectilineatus]|uniref:AMP-binding protein n=1 Tax=Actinoplanes rectilineatus TaxID=113571 RepID=UPI0005F2D0FD|nr:AMP-binding protein [Actinoplanes rectilineatus]
MSWDLARLWSAVATDQPQRLALIHGDRSLTWGQFDAAAASFAATLREAGVRRGDVVAMCLPNVLEYLVLFAGALRCGASPCGVNYRYLPHELSALLARLRPAVVCHLAGSDAEHLAVAQLPEVRLWHAVRPVTAGSLDPLLESGGDSEPIQSHPDDVLLKCTGGTTGAPVAVRWRVGDVLEQLNRHNPWHRHDLTTPTLVPATVGDRPRLLVASPLMHGSGLNRALGALCAAGTVITLPRSSFDPAQLLDIAAKRRATALAIVGDAHATALADALDAEPHRWRLPALATITSSGAAWTQPVKQRLLTHLPHVRLSESLGATEATGLGFSTATTDAVPATGEFTLGHTARIFTDDGVPAKPGETGSIGVSAPHPAGLHLAGALPDERFVSHDGRRYLMSGDRVLAIDENRFRLLGRPDDCINTGGEKVFAPEVTDALLRHPGVRDAVVLGVPHPRLGSAVTALVQLRPGITVSDVAAHARHELAGFKVPAIVLAVPEIPRTTAGKPDLTAARSAVPAHLRRSV